MIINTLMSFGFEDDDFVKEIENSLQMNHYSFLLRSTKGKKIALVDAVLKIGRKETDIVPEPISSSTGFIGIPLGNSPHTDFKIYFRVYAYQTIPKAQAFLINDTTKKIVRATPAGDKKKSLVKKELWDEKV